jgi:hypothetical protein
MTTGNYQTSDLALAAYLSMKGYSILAVDFQTDNKAVFQFEDSPGRSKDVLMFFNRQTTVEPIGFLDHVKSLKAMLKQ